MSDIRYERVKIIGVMSDARDRVGYYRDALEEEGTEEDRADLDWAKKVYVILGNLTNDLIMQ